MSTQSLACIHKGRICVCASIKMNLCVCTVLKKKSLCSFTGGKRTHPFILPRSRNRRYRNTLARLPSLASSAHRPVAPPKQQTNVERATGGADHGLARRSAGCRPRADDVLAREAAPGFGDGGGAIGAGSQGKRRRDWALGKLI